MKGDIFTFYTFIKCIIILLFTSFITQIYSRYGHLLLFVVLQVWETICMYFVETETKTNKQKKKQYTWSMSQDCLVSSRLISSHKSRTCIYPAQQRPGEQDVTAKLLVVLQHWVPLCVTVDNLFTLVRITSQVRQPVNPPHER